MEPPVTLEIKCDSTEADEIRAVLGSYVRLSFTEKTRWFRQTFVFTVQGPSADVQRMKNEVDDLLCRMWHDRQW